MKNIIAAKMSAIRKRSALSSSAASSVDSGATRDGFSTGSVPKEPSSHQGQMRMPLDDSDPSVEPIDIVLCISVDSVHAVADVDNSIVFEAAFGLLKEVIWDHTECSLCFVTVNGIRSASFIFVETLVDVEQQLTSALRFSGLQRLPDQVYVGVLVGRNLPSSPIHQRRASLNAIGVQQPPSLPAALRRELLAHERPPRAITPREKLALEYFKSGNMSFPCSINGDGRGLKLDGNFLYVFPTPVSHDRSACLFSYQYEQIDSCEVRSGVRLELRFRRSGAKQPTFIAFQSPDAQYIRDAIWYFKYGTSMDEYFRRATKTNGINSLEKTCLSPRPRRSSLKCFQNEDELVHRVQSRCIVIGCNRCRDEGLWEGTLIDHSPDLDLNDGFGSRKGWMCEDHAPPKAELGSPPRSPSKRSGLLSRGRSCASLLLLIHTKHYMQSVKYHGILLKNGGKYQMTKAWNQKIVALIDTPLGGFICYYDKLSHCPGLSETPPKERRVIDLSSVICVRRESIPSKGSHPVPYAFDVVSVYRTWTFAASDMQEYEVWLSLLGEVIEKQSSMSPDKPLRFPIKCLRDPLHNLPSRNDGTTTLEISSNGVTVCSGTDGESEVYNWYFTEIQKWSVAKQHDNSTCCFISCAVDPISVVGSHVDASTRYQDFLFQTPEADTICCTIEFFVGRCMAKLEMLGLMHLRTQNYQSSRRPSVEPSPINPLPQQSGDEKHGKVVSAQEHETEVVSSYPVTTTPSTSLPKRNLESPSFESNPIPDLPQSTIGEAHIVQQPTATFPSSIGEEPIMTVEDVVGPSSIASSKATNTLHISTANRSELLREDAPRTIEDTSNEWPKYRLAPPPMIETRSVESIVRPDDPTAMDLLPPCSEDHEPSCDSLLTSISKEAESSTMSNCLEDTQSELEVQNDGDDSRRENCLNSVHDGVESIANRNCIDEASVRSEVEISTSIIVESGRAETVLRSQDWLEDLEYLNRLYSQHLLNNNDGGGHREGDNDRFQSFEYCECTVGVQDDTSEMFDSIKEVEAENDTSVWEDEDFEDARCDPVDITEVSLVVMDGGLSENDEESLVVLEEEDSSTLHVDMIGESDPRPEIMFFHAQEECVLDDADAVVDLRLEQGGEIKSSHTEDAYDLDYNKPIDLGAVSGTAECDALEHANAVRITIPTFTPRKWAETVDVTGYDDSLPRVTVFSVRFHRGRLKRLHHQA